MPRRLLNKLMPSPSIAASLSCLQDQKQWNRRLLVQQVGAHNIASAIRSHPPPPASVMPPEAARAALRRPSSRTRALPTHAHSTRGATGRAGTSTSFSQSPRTRSKPSAAGTYVRREPAVRACLRAYVRVCACACTRACVLRACVRACVRVLLAELG